MSRRGLKWGPPIQEENAIHESKFDSQMSISMSKCINLARTIGASLSSKLSTEASTIQIQSLPSTSNGAQSQQSGFNIDFEINDSPYRNVLIKKQIHEQIYEKTGALLKVRGVYQPPGLQGDNAASCEKKLHLFVCASTSISLQNTLGLLRALYSTGSMITTGSGQPSSGLLPSTVAPQLFHMQNPRLTSYGTLPPMATMMSTFVHPYSNTQLPGSLNTWAPEHKTECVVASVPSMSQQSFQPYIQPPVQLINPPVNFTTKVSVDHISTAASGHPKFNFRIKLVGVNRQNLKNINTSTGASVLLHGRGTGINDHEDMHLEIKATSEASLQAALAQVNALVESVRKEFSDLVTQPLAFNVVPVGVATGLVATQPPGILTGVPPPPSLLSSQQSNTTNAAYSHRPPISQPLAGVSQTGIFPPNPGPLPSPYAHFPLGSSIIRPEGLNSAPVQGLPHPPPLPPGLPPQRALVPPGLQVGAVHTHPPPPPIFPSGTALPLSLRPPPPLVTPTLSIPTTMPAGSLRPGPLSDNGTGTTSSTNSAHTSNSSSSQAPAPSISMPPPSGRPSKGKCVPFFYPGTDAIIKAPVASPAPDEDERPGTADLPQSSDSGGGEGSGGLGRRVSATGRQLLDAETVRRLVSFHVPAAARLGSKEEASSGSNGDRGACDEAPSLGTVHFSGAGGDSSGGRSSSSSSDGTSSLDRTRTVFVRGSAVGNGAVGGSSNSGSSSSSSSSSSNSSSSASSIEGISRREEHRTSASTSQSAAVPKKRKRGFQENQAFEDLGSKFPSNVDDTVHTARRHSAVPMKLPGLCAYDDDDYYDTGV